MENWPVDTKILIVDDFQAMRVKLIDCLSQMGYANLEDAGSAETAFKKLKIAVEVGDKFGLILSDWNMEGMTGLELLSQIRNDEDLKETPFIMITAEGGEEQIIEAIKAGVNDYLIKPFNDEMLRRKLEESWAKFDS